jgi:antitoxin PrlF
MDEMPARKHRAGHAIASSRLTSKSQATVPASVRKKLNLNPGDTVIFEESQTGTVSIRKAEPLDLEFLSALEKTLSEWNSVHDDRAYRDL